MLAKLGVMRLPGRLGVFALTASFVVAPAYAEDFLVRDQAQYANALKQVEAGDVIILANGVWRDFEIEVTGKGEAGNPITVRAQEAGKVVLTGQSSLRVGGEHMLVKGFVFKDGYSPRGEVISFRRSKSDTARNSRVTEMVIDGYSKPDRYDDDRWVTIYGKNNRFDHNNLIGKTNKGVTLAVRLDSEESRENNHLIDHNYFGPRPVLGSNGGETLRIGTSKYSMFNSNSRVESNVFDRTSGEVEIISSKSGGNVFRGNLFLKSRGTLTLRHGDNNVVEGNVFLGGGADYTGGIRVINRFQTIRGNYMEGLRGDAFSSALAIMNGVPNSPVNRYVEVEGAKIDNNTIVDSRRVAFNVGADTERSAAPSKTSFANNLLSGLNGESFLEAYDDISGITFDGNRVAGGDVQAELAGKVTRTPVEMARGENGLLYPTNADLADVGAPRDLKVPSLDKVGASYYPKPKEGETFGSSGRTVEVMPGEDTLVTAIMQAAGGDILMLAPGEYIVNRTIPLDKSLTLTGSVVDGGNGPVIKFGRPSLFELQEGGNLQLQKLTVDGELAPDSVGNSMIKTSSFPIQSNLEIALDEVTVRGLVVNKSFNVITLGKSSMAQRVSITNSKFSDITGTILQASAETEDYGQYNVEYLTMARNSFANIGGPIASIYRGGRDESTFGPFVQITENALSNVGKAPTNGTGGSIHLHGVQTTMVDRNELTNSLPLRIVHTVGTPKTQVVGNRFSDTPKPIFEELNFEGAPRMASRDNLFEETVKP
ncbi:MAG: polysaccharide lyase 6 family protein [Erythrobacter sp.]